MASSDNKLAFNQQRIREIEGRMQRIETEISNLEEYLWNSPFGTHGQDERSEYRQKVALRNKLVDDYSKCEAEIETLKPWADASPEERRRRGREASKQQWDRNRK